ncbi:hypothetical protein OS493_034645 [Desmophyllum pertusum]|uniref:G-protein coupled receptors family 1 profile domain-containing protein n=1 Tax=Desmophyllum pertusum TaxID=174260 RepID=A0A9X0D2J3_9CNID|nr:hypothetical protein OS493_034645 [Desmophyllum pertusum]
MERDFEKSLCLGTGITFIFMLLFISVPNGLILIALYRNPLRCFRKAFSVFLAFIAAVDLFVGIVVCSGETVMRFLCAFGEKNVPQDGDIVRILGYIGVNSSILLVTAMSVDRFISVVCPHFYLRKVTPRKLILCNTIIVVFSTIFASLQLTGISLDTYLLIDIHLHTTFPLVTTALAYFGIFLCLKKHARDDLQRQSAMPSNTTLHDMRRVNIAKRERKFALTCFLILIFLIISLIPYFAAILIDANCYDCRGQKWFMAFGESSVAFLFVNSFVNPFLTTFRIGELKQSVKIVFWRRNQVDISGLGDFQLQDSSGNIRSV